MTTRRRKLGQSLCWFAGDKIYTEVDEESDPNYIRVCNESAIKLLKSTALTIAIIIITLNIYLGFPVYSTLFAGEFQLPVAVYFSFTDYSTTYGIVINIVNNLFICIVGLLGLIGIEIITCMLKNTVWACTVAVRYSLVKLSVLLENSEQIHQELSIVYSVIF